MAADKKKKKGKGSGKGPLLLGVLLGMVVLLIVVYYFKFGVLPFAEGKLGHFVKIWEWLW